VATLAELPNVMCKLSGLFTEADPEGTVERALAWFGPERCMWGSDWPVCTLASGYADGLALIGGSRLADSHTCIDHGQPHGTSRQLHKCIVDGAAHAVFNGRVIVRPGAQKTDSAQSSRNLLLTTRAVVDALPRSFEITVITHSPTIAAALLDHPQAELFLLGGRVFKHSAVTCGAAAVEAAQNISADFCLLGVTGVHPEAGLTTGDAEEAAMKRALAARAADTYILASSEKIGTASRFRVLPWEEISGLITDADPRDPVVEQLKALGVEVLTAD
jgi:hypothetical protein